MHSLSSQVKLFLLDKKPFSRPWYQYFEAPDGFNNFKYVENRGKQRTQLMTDALLNADLKHEDVVLDVGCNAGVFGIFLSKYVKKTIGVELDKKFYRQALFLKDYFGKFFELENHVVLNSDITKLGSKLLEEHNVLILSKVIYHNNLNETQDKLLDTLIHKKVNKIIIQGHTTQGELGSLAYLNAILEKYNFASFHEVRHHEYPIVIAERNTN